MVNKLRFDLVFLIGYSYGMYYILNIISYNPKLDYYWLSLSI